MTLEETYIKHREHILHFLSNKFGLGSEDAEDVVQDAYLKAIGQPEPSGGLWEAFLFQCVKSVAMDFLKVTGNRERLFHEKWDKIVKGFNLEEPPEVKVTQKTGLGNDSCERFEAIQAENTVDNRI